MLDRELKTNNDGKKDAEENLRALYGLFPSTTQILPRQVNFASIDRFNDFSPTVSKTEPTLGKTSRGMSPWLKPLLYICFAFLVVALATSFYKSQFLDVGVNDPGLSSSHVHHLCSDQRTCNDQTYGLHLHRLHSAEHLARHYLVLHLRLGMQSLTQPWWNSTYIDSNSLNSLRGFTIIMVGLLWVVKVTSAQPGCRYRHHVPQYSVAAF